LACNRNNYKSRFRLRLGRNRYDPTTFRPLESDKKRRQKEAERPKKKQEKKAKAKAKAKKRKEVLKKQKQDSATPSGSEFNSSGSESDSDGDSGSESESEEEDVIKRGEEILLGTHCQKRSHIYHQMCHWGMSSVKHGSLHETDVLQSSTYGTESRTCTTTSCGPRSKKSSMTRTHRPARKSRI
jgi:hypothetical protein